MTTAQEIRKEMVLGASKQTVWNAITTKEGWTGWFSEDIQGEFKVGQTFTMNFGPETTCYGVVVEREEMSSFAYRWHPGEDCALDKYPEEEMTTVRFVLSDHSDGTLLTMIESGFERIPESRQARCVEMNTKGWKWELEELRAFVEEGVRQSKSGDNWDEQE